ncbi:type VI secretion system-associated protein TagF [Marivita sp. S0852]|uniref:type VI secretion system-associated protein TagF n=1 Tax=Marivita sp. S0852 TaxID=3373893 RepID=UPI003982A529
MPVDGYGAFGKIPAVGDFFRVNAPPGFVEPWDAWLQRCLLAGSEAHGPGWDALYMSVPIWRFCLSAGLAGAQPVIGVLMPSVDRVGRRFPLTLMTPIGDGASVVREHLVQGDAFQSMEDIALSVLDDDVSKDALAAQLAALALPIPAAPDLCHVNGRAVVLRQTAGPEALAPILASELLAPAFQRPSVWSAVMDGDTRLMVCDGLPDGPDMQGLFDLDADVWKEGCV